MFAWIFWRLLKLYVKIELHLLPRTFLLLPASIFSILTVHIGLELANLVSAWGAGVSLACSLLTLGCWFNCLLLTNYFSLSLLMFFVCDLPRKYFVCIFIPFCTVGAFPLNGKISMGGNYVFLYLQPFKHYFHALWAFIYWVLVKECVFSMFWTFRRTQEICV